MRTLLTGGAGFIGSHLAEALVGAGHTVRVLDNLSTGRLENLAALRSAPGFELIEGDIRDPETLAAAMAGAEAVFHLAALISVPLSVEQPELSFEINTLGTVNVLRSAAQAGAGTVVLASSAAVYGDNPHLPHGEALPIQPTSPYGLDKGYGERFGAFFAAARGLNVTALRFFNVYGPRQHPGSPYSGVISRFIDCMHSGRAPIIFGDGEQTRDFVHVSDVVAACLAAGQGAPGEPAGGGFRCFNVAGGQAITINALYEILRDLTEAPPAAVYRPERKGDLRHSLADIGAIRNALGYRPAVSLQEGLAGLLREGLA